MPCAPETNHVRGAKKGFAPARRCVIVTSLHRGRWRFVQHINPTGVTMKPQATKMICRVLIVSMFAMPLQAARAGMIGTDQLLAPATSQSQRAAVMATLSRSDVSSQLQSLGVDPSAATERVASMTDQEVASLAGKLDALPAGASSAGTNWAIAIVIALLIWYYYK
jgi:hypothetical protein